MQFVFKKKILLKKLLLPIFIICCTFTNNVFAIIYVVNSTADDGSPGTLRSAINLSNNSPSVDSHIHINLAPASTITLTSNLPPIQQSVFITGGNTPGLRIDGNNQFSIFFVYGGASASVVNVSLENMTIQNGLNLGGFGGDGAGAGGGAMGGGGAVFVDRNVALTSLNVAYLNNTARGGDGGNATVNTPSGGGGGGMLRGFGGTSTNVTVTGSGGGGGLGGAGGAGVNTSFLGSPGQPGILVGAAGGGASASGAPGGTAAGGGGGGGIPVSGSGRAPVCGGGGGVAGGAGATINNNPRGGSGGDFGGGGGSGAVPFSSNTSFGGNAGFGGGGGGAGPGGTPSDGGGSVGGSGSFFDGIFAGGSGGARLHGGGGGSGLGGAIIVRQGGSLIIQSNTFTGNTVTAGGGGTGFLGNGAPGIAQGEVLYLNASTATFSTAGGTQTVSNTIAGSGGLIVNGGGNLILNAANTFSGGTVVNSSTITANNNSALGSGSLTLNGATLQTTVGNIFLNNPWIIGPTGGTIGGGASITLNGAGTLRGSLLVSNTSTTTLNGTLTQTGAIASLTLNAPGGTLFLNGNNNIYSGGTFVNAGTLILGSGSAFPNSTNLTVNAPGIFNLNGFLITVNDLNGTGSIVLANNAHLTVGTANTSNFSGVISGTGRIIKQNSGNLILSGANTYSGPTVLIGGTITANNNSALGAGTAFLTMNADGVTLQTTVDGTTLSIPYIVNGSAIIGGVNSLSLTLSGPGTLNNLLTIRNAATTTLSGVITGPGSILMNSLGGTGNLVLSGDNTYRGGTTLKAGTLTVNHNNALGGPTGGALAFNGGLLKTDIAGTNIPNAFSVALAGGTIGGTQDIILSGNGTLNGNLTIINSGDTTLSGAIGGSGPRTITMNGTGELILSGANSYAGGTILNSGTLSADNNSALGSGTLALNGGVLQTNVPGTILNNPFTVGPGGSTIGGINDLTLNGAGVLSGPLTVTNTGTTRLGGTIGGTGSIIMNSLGGVLVLSGANNNYSGGTTVLSGTLRLGQPTSFPPFSNLTVNGGVFDLNNNSITVGTLSGTGGAITLGTGNLTVDSLVDSTFAGNISGAGALIMQSASNHTLTLSGTNTYTGGTIVNIGTLRIGSATAFPNGGNLTINGGTFDLNNFNITVGDLNGGGGTIALGSGTLTVGTANDATFSGGITGTGNVIKQGTGTLTLDGPVSYTGTTTVNAGTFSLGGGTLSGPVNIAANATFDFSGGIVTGAIAGPAGSTVTVSDTTTTFNTISVGSIIVQGSLFVINNPITVLDPAGLSTIASTVVLNNNINGSVFIVNNSVLSVSAARSISGNFTLSGDSVFDTIIQDTSNFGRILVGGTATINNGATIFADLAPNFNIQTDDIFDIISASAPPIVDLNNITVTTGSNFVSFVNSPITFLPSIVGNNLRLTAIQNTTFLEKNVTNPIALVMARALEAIQFSFNLSRELQEAIFALAKLPTPQALTTALISTAPVTNGGLFYTNLMALDQVFDKVENFTQTLCASADKFLPLGYVAGDTCERCDSCTSFGPILFGSGQRQRSIGPFDSYRAHTLGAGLIGDADITKRSGLDADSVRLGLGLAYSFNEVSTDTRKDTYSKADTAHLLAFASIEQNLAFLQLIMDAGNNWYKSQRTIVIGPINQAAHATYQGLQFSARATLGYMLWDLFETTPKVIAQYTGSFVNGYNERDAGALNLSVKSQTTQLVQLAAGFTCRYTEYRNYIVPEFHAYYTRDITTPLIAVTSQFTETGPTFVVPGPPDAKNTVNVGAGITTGLYRGCIQMSLTYDFYAKKNYTSHAGFARFRWLF